MNTERPKVYVTRLEARLVAKAASLHNAAFPQFFLTFLGERFLRLFYSAFVADPASVSWVAETHDGAICGIVVGTVQPRGFYKRLLRRRWWAFAAAGIPAILRRPSIFGRLLRAVAYRGGASGSPDRALLSSIAVHPNVRGSGIGGLLIAVWCEEVCRRGCAGAYLFTDADNNDEVNKFYQRHGWIAEQTAVTLEGRRMTLYCKDFVNTKP